MPYRLRDHLFLGLVDGEIVFLDLLANRYFLAPASMRDAIVTLVGNGGLNPSGQTKLAPLIERGLLIEDEDGRLAGSNLSTPISSILDGPRYPVPAGLVLAAISSQVAAAVRLKTTPIHRIVERIRQRKNGSGGAKISEGAHDLHSSAAAFQRAGKFFATDDRCLRRSLAFVDFLARRHSYPELVFGVRFRPFGAHCWLQRGTTVLNDGLDEVRLYTPVLVV